MRVFIIIIDMIKLQKYPYILNILYYKALPHTSNLCYFTLHTTKKVMHERQMLLLCSALLKYLPGPSKFDIYFQ